MEKLIKLYFSPLVFGLAFIAPLIAQTLTALGYEFFLPNLVIGLVAGGALGLMAQLRGSWLWIR